MNIINFDDCIYQGDINYDFFRFIIGQDSLDFPTKLKIRTYFLFSKFSKYYRKKYWLFLNQIFCLEDMIQSFYEKQENKLNDKVLDILPSDITVLCKSPLCLIQPFLPKQICDHIGYSVDFEHSSITKSKLNEKLLKKQLLHHKSHINLFLDNHINMYTFFAKNAYFCSASGIKKVNGKFWKSIILRMIFRLFLILCFSLTIECFTFLMSSNPFNSTLFSSFYQDYRIFLLTLFPILMLMLILYILLNKLWLSALLTCLPFYILGYANFFKLAYRDYPVVYSDLTLFSEATIMAEKYDITPTVSLLVAALLFIAVILLFSKIKSLKIKMPFLRGILVAAIGLFTYFGIHEYMLKDGIYQYAGDENAIKNRWIESQQLQRRGVLYAFVYSYKNSFEQVPADYDETKAAEVLKAYASSDIPEDKKVNIIAIMLESYNDFSKFDLTFTEDIYAPLHQFEEEGYYGELRSNVFGGGTVDTERSFITGYFHHPLYNRPSNSYVRYLKEQGYKTVALHPCYGSFYNRRNINTYLGYDEFYYVENRYEKVSLDDVFFPDIIAEFDKQTASNQPYFNFSLNYQGHGPYPKENNDQIKDYLIVQEEIDEGTLNGINYYFNGIKNTNDHLQELHDHLQNSEKPTVVILFGDHNPVFGSGSDGFEMIGINMDISSEEGFHNYYGTPYVIWSNNAAKQLYGNNLKSGVGPTLSPNFLMNELFVYLGWEGNAYMKYTNEIKNIMPVIHNNRKLVNGDWIQELDESAQKLLQEFQSVEYYYKYKTEE